MTERKTLLAEFIKFLEKHDEKSLIAIAKPFFSKATYLKNFIENVKDKNFQNIRNETIKKFLTTSTSKVEEKKSATVTQPKIISLEDFITILKNKKSKYGAEYDENSMKTYLNAFKNLCHIINGDTREELNINYLEDPEPVYERISQQDRGVEWKRKTFSIIGLIAPQFYKTAGYKKITDKLYHEARDHVVPLKKSVLENVDKIQSEIASTSKEEFALSKDRDKFLKFLVVSLPVRSGILRELKYKNYDVNTDNYYHDGKLYINNSKTSRVYVEKLKEDVDQNIKKLITFSKSDYVINNNENEKYKQSTFSKLLKHLGVPSGQIRKADSYDPEFKEKYEEKTKRGKLLDHSVATQQNYYNVNLVDN